MKKVLMVIGWIVVGIVVLIGVAFLYVSLTSEKLVCESDQGKITIMYNDKTIKGYTASGYSYDLDGQREYAEQIGIDAYIEEFSDWFSNNTNGTCSK